LNSPPSAQLEKLKSEKNTLTSEVTDLRTARAELELRANSESEKCAEMKKKLSYCEVKVAEFRYLIS
jgi:FtsZ-binding cell division protein ZapB